MNTYIISDDLNGQLFGPYDSIEAAEAVIDKWRANGDDIFGARVEQGPPAGDPAWDDIFEASPEDF